MRSRYICLLVLCLLAGHLPLSAQEGGAMSVKSFYINERDLTANTRLFELNCSQNFNLSTVYMAEGCNPPYLYVDDHTTIVYM